MKPRKARTQLTRVTRSHELDGVRLARLGVGLVEVGEVAHRPGRQLVEGALDHLGDRRGSRSRRRGTPAPRPRSRRSARTGRCRRRGGLAGEAQARERVLVGRARRSAARARRGRAASRARRRARGSGARRRSARACRGSRGARATRRRSGGRARGRSTAGAPRRRCGRSGTPNRCCASITSRPLFISVAESIVILPPMSQVGWASACSRVTLAELRRRLPRNGPPRGGEDEPVDRPGPLLSDHELEERGVLRVDRDHRRARGLGERHHELAAHHEALLVGQREVDALAERRDRRAEPGRAHQRVQAPGRSRCR